VLLCCDHDLSLRVMRYSAAFMTMAGEIKARMALVPQAEDGPKGSSVSVGKGDSVGKTGGGGCC
jgi:hypothetical protein